MNLKYLLFDWDGCLADTLSVWMEQYKVVFKEFGLEPSETDITSKAFGDYQGPIKLGLKSEDLLKFNDILLARIENGMRDVRLHKNVFETLEKLKAQRKRMCIVTSSKKSYVQESVNRNGISKMIEFIVDADDVKHHKPAPDIIFKALEKFRAHADEAIIIGDSDKDVWAGQNAKIKTVLFYPEINSRFYSEDYLKNLKSDLFIKDFLELLKIDTLLGKNSN